MRISNQTLMHNALRDLRGNLQALVRAQQDVTSGRKVRTLSDDPVNASQIMRLDASLRDIDQYRRNGASANTRLSAEDVVLTSARKLIERAKGLAMSVATLPIGDPQRTAALAEVQQIQDQMVSLGNTKVGDEYIFAGGRTTTPAFLLDGTYVGDTTVHRAGIDEGVFIDTNHTGNSLFGSTLQALQSLSQEIQTGDAASIEVARASLIGSDQQLMTLQAEVGGRLRQIKDTADILARRNNTLLDRRGEIRDVDPTEAVLKVTAAQAALDRAYAAVGKILQTTLLDYLT
jgi:flagellar hook-associated protein 3 FlgL